MNIWVDADSCPRAIKEILFRVAERTAITVTLIANQPMTIRPSRFIKFIQVPTGFDLADHEILRRVMADDLVITADIPLAYEVIEKGAHVINPRGERYTQDNIRQQLNLRDFMDTMRFSGIEMGGGPAAMTAKDNQAFANQLDRFLASRH